MSDEHSLGREDEIISGSVIAMPYNIEVGLGINSNTKYCNNINGEVIFTENGRKLIDEYFCTFPEIFTTIKNQTMCAESFDAQQIQEEVIKSANHFRNTKVETVKPKLNPKSSVYIPPSQRASTFVRPLSPNIAPYYPPYMYHEQYPQAYYTQPVYYPSMYMDQSSITTENETAEGQQPKRKKKKKKKKSVSKDAQPEPGPYLKALLSKQDQNVPESDPDPTSTEPAPPKSNLVKLKKRRPVRKHKTRLIKGKNRVAPKKKRLSKLKQIIVGERLKNVKEKEWLTDDETEPIPKQDPTAIREYVDQPLDAQLDSTVQQLLSKLVKCQQKLKQKEPLKYKTKQRLVMGLRQVLKGLKSGRIHYIVMAPNIEKIESKDGLDDMIQSIIKIASEKNVPVVYALSKRKIGKALGKQIKVSVVGIYNADGAFDELKTALNLVRKIKN
ncbi:selenocysteine insertion sequence-binding protein [Acrasis kona]|uniref:Selenocysteine insertion sequence-binding protein n=1 Tax=Acrasis kona TaxID=1008807 RepID=A0AAW2Z8G3_9EUKA